MLQRVARSAALLGARCTASDLLSCTRAAACACSSKSVDIQSWQQQGQRCFADLVDEPAEVRIPAKGNERVQKLAEDIVNLNLLEVSDLTDLLREKLGLSMTAGMMPQMMGGPQQAAPAAAVEEAPAKEEQTEFDVTLDGFGASDKIKVIKEVRGVLPELGLKDAKVLVSMQN